MITLFQKISWTKKQRFWNALVIALLLMISNYALVMAVPLMAVTENKIVAADASAGDWFGYAVAINGDTAVVGAYLSDDNGTDSGSAYVYTRSGSIWTQQAKLIASDASEGDVFGYSVAIDGNTVVIGALYGDGSVARSGSAYVFIRSGSTWTQQAKLIANDAGGLDEFGHSVAIDGDTVIVGANFDDDAGTSSGSAYVYVRSGSTWSQQAKLTASDAATNDQFGRSVNISGDTAVIGARWDDHAGLFSGSAYVFIRSGSTWTQQAKLIANDAAAVDEFGHSVAIDGDTVIVGSLYDLQGSARSGSAYVFTRSGSTWSQQAKLTANDAGELDQFGRSLALDGNTVVIGAPGDDDGGSDSGSTYVFTRSGSIWSQQIKLTSSDAAALDEFGWAVTISGDKVLVGSFRDDDSGSDSGSAYVFDINSNTPVGTNVNVVPVDTATSQTPVALIFANVTVEGDSSLSTSTTGPAPPAGFALGTPETYYDLSTTAVFSGTIEVCIDYTGVSYILESALALMHYEGGMWVDVTTSLDTANDIVCGDVNSFSPFTVMESVPPPPTLLPPAFLLEWGSSGTGNGQFFAPGDVSLDSAGNVYVADQGNNRIQKFDSSGNFLLKWGSFGTGDGQFRTPTDVAVDSSGNVYVADAGTNRIQKFNSSGNFLLKWGVRGAGDGQFESPEGVAVDSSGNVYVADVGNYRIQKFDSSGNFLLAWGSFGTGDGQFDRPSTLSLDSAGNVYVADLQNHRIQKFDSSGNFLLKWGANGTTDGQFNFPSGISVDDVGNIHVVDRSNNRIQIFNSNGDFLLKWGSFGMGDGEFNRPLGITIDPDGKVYVTDEGNNRIQKFGPVSNTTPEAEAAGPYAVDEGASVQLTGSGTDIDGDMLTFAWDLDNDGVFETLGQDVPFSASSLDGPSSQTVVLRVCDEEPLCAFDSAMVDILNAAPSSDAGPDQTVNEEESITLSGDGSDPGGDPLTFNWDLDNDGVFETPGQNVAFSAAGRMAPDSQTVVLEVCDDESACSTDEALVQIVEPASELPTVCLYESDGVTGLAGASVEYYAGGWQPFGATDVDGCVEKDIQPKSYSFRMSYAGTSVKQTQDVGVDSVVVFQTVNVTAELRDSTGALLDTGSAEYYAGGWISMGDTVGGQASIELLPKSYSFRMSYAGTSVKQTQDVGVDPVVVFQTVNVTAELRDSTGTLLDTGSVEYYAGGWISMGDTVGGQVSIELLPKSYSFRMSYAGTSVKQTQDVGVDSVVVFQTVNVTAELRDSTGALLDTGSAEYYAGGWISMGDTVGGQASIELLPKSYNFRMSYAGTSVKQTQDVGVDPVVVFQTGSVISSSGMAVEYYASGWKPFSNGMQLLPKEYKFRFNDGTADTIYSVLPGAENIIH